MEAPGKLAVSVVEAARMLSISRSNCYALCDQGIIPSFRLGEKRRLISLKALQEFVDRQGEGGK